MLEDPELPANWGVRPVLGHLGSSPIPAYGMLVVLGVLAGLALLWRDSRGEPRRGHLGLLAVAGLLGGALGAKLVEWAFNADLVARVGWLAALLSGRTIIGGFLGGTLAVGIVKRWMGVTARRGNLLAAPVALGLAIGRLGCFLHGCCFGTATRLPWGVDFGDGVVRHPTQLYETAFALVAFAVLRAVRRRVTTSGRLFGGFMVTYFAFRFLEEFLRAEPRPVLGMTLYQVGSLAGLVYFLVRELRAAPVSRQMQQMERSLA